MYLFKSSGALLCLIGTGALAYLPAVQAAPLTLEDAVNRALASDTWIKSSQFNESSQRSMGDAAGRLPDPRFNLALANMPSDKLDFNQEPMTQLVFGVSQMIPRGDTLELNSSKFEQQADMQPLLREERKARVRMEVSQLWLDAWQAQRSIDLIDDNRALFEQLVDVTTSSYVSALGRTRQQDLIRAQLELTQLDNRLSRLQQQRDMASAKLSEWLINLEAEDAEIPASTAIEFPTATPQLASSESALEQVTNARRFIGHPSIQLFDRQIELSRTDVDLAEQKYKPQWGLSASYGYRGDDAMGSDRADLMSVGVSVEMPLFSTRKQDSEVDAASSRVEAVRTERLLKLRQLVSAYDNAKAAYVNASDRIALYQQQLLPQSHEAAEAALNAYTSDDGDFAEVVRARISELDNHLALIELSAQQQKQLAQINYLLTSVDSEGR